MDAVPEKSAENEEEDEGDANEADDIMNGEDRDYTYDEVIKAGINSLTYIDQDDLSNALLMCHYPIF